MMQLHYLFNKIPLWIVTEYKIFPGLCLLVIRMGYFQCVKWLTILSLFAGNWVCSSGKLITDLPGLDTTIDFKQYSGYITVDEAANSRLFYWYVESQSNASTDPLVLWLNGGPGCSSLGGFLGELGPFYVEKDLKLGLNKYSWNKKANMLFLEAPYGVGFSKSSNPAPYTDEKTAEDSLQFLIKFFAEFPHLKKLDFWLTGESYAGHYIPTLATKVVEYNKMISSEDAIAIKGLMIGNPLTSLPINSAGTADFIYSHHLISIGTYNGIRQNCNYSFPDFMPKQSINPSKCEMFESQAAAEQGNINAYDIYVDVCTSERKYSRNNGITLLKCLANSNLEMSAYARGIIKQRMLKSPYDPCQDNYLQSYLNDPAVQKAIYAEATNWTDCNDEINGAWSKSDFAASMIPLYTDVLFKANLKILIYSGDVDSVVPATSTRHWIHSLHRNIVSPWKPWIDSRGQVGGYTFVTDKLTYATVRGAGHEVPTFQPMRAYDMFQSFLDS